MKLFKEEGLKGFFVGARNDLWFNKVDWADNIITGRSKIVVVQPTIKAGYKITFADGLISFIPAIGLGWEINVVTKDDEYLFVMCVWIMIAAQEKDSFSWLDFLLCLI